MKLAFKNTSPLIKFLIVVYLAAGFVFVFGRDEWFPDFYNPLTMTILAFVSVFIILALEIFLQAKEATRNAALNVFKNMIVISLLINGAGGLGLYKLYKVGFEYDKLTHFVTPFLLTIGIFRLIYAFRKYDFKKCIAIAAFIVFTLGIIWEFIERISNKLFAGDVFVLGGGSSILRDTVLDVVCNTLGILTAIVYLHIKKNKVVAIPAEKLTEA